MLKTGCVSNKNFRTILRLFQFNKYSTNLEGAKWERIKQTVPSFLSSFLPSEKSNMFSKSGLDRRVIQKRRRRRRKRKKRKDYH